MLCLVIRMHLLELASHTPILIPALNALQSYGLKTRKPAVPKCADILEVYIILFFAQVSVPLKSEIDLFNALFLIFRSLIFFFTMSTSDFFFSG